MSGDQHCIFLVANREWPRLLEAFHLDADRLKPAPGVHLNNHPESKTQALTLGDNQPTTARN